jgi:epoxyqueuosine reductase
MPDVISPSLDLHALAGRVKAKARELGFDLVGIAPTGPSRYRNYLRQWLDDGQAGTMRYLAERFDQRTDPASYFPGAQSAICVAMNYFVELDLPAQGDVRGRIARYALGDDYHQVIKDRLHELADWLRAEAPAAQTRCAVDTAPVMEKELAARAGIGWQGKNTCIINGQIGSWLLLGEVLTTLPLPPDDPAIDRCGTCTRCIDACPTGAITEPYRIDARRCISYLTIEHRADDIAPDLRRATGDWLYGCDVCQDVCPWNRTAPIAQDLSLMPRFASGTLGAPEIMEWGDDEYRQRLRNSAMKRVKLPLLKRNAAIVQENTDAAAAQRLPPLPRTRGRGQDEGDF